MSVLQFQWNTLEKVRGVEMRGKVWKDTMAVVAVIVLVALSGCGVSSSVAPEDNNETDDLYIYGENGDFLRLEVNRYGGQRIQNLWNQLLRRKTDIFY